MSGVISYNIITSILATPKWQQEQPRSMLCFSGSIFLLYYERFNVLRLAIQPYSPFDIAKVQHVEGGCRLVGIFCIFLHLRTSANQQNDVLYVWRMGKHVDGLYGSDAIVGIH